MRKLWIAHAHPLARPLSAAHAGVAVVGAGWAGLAAPCEATAPATRSPCSRWRTSWAAAREPGRTAGTARQRPAHPDRRLHADAGLMRQVGVDTEAAAAAHPTGLVDRARRPRPAPAARRRRCRHLPAVWGRAAGRWRDRLALLARGQRDGPLRGFRCDPAATVESACAPACRLDGAREPDRPAVRRGAEHARQPRPAPPCSCACCATRCSAAGRGRPAAAAPPAARPAARARHIAGCNGMAPTVQTGATRVSSCSAMHGRLACRRRALRRVVLACSLPRRRGWWSRSGADLVGKARGFRAYEPIVTVYLRCERRLPARADAGAAGGRRCAGAVRVRSSGQLGGPPGLLAFVISGARPGSKQGLRRDARGQALLAQARRTARALCRRRRPRRAAHRSPRSAPPSAAPPGWNARRWRSPPACWPPATTSKAPTRPRWKAPCAAGRRCRRCPGLRHLSVGPDGHEPLSPCKIAAFERNPMTCPRPKSQTPTIQVLERMFDCSTYWPRTPTRCR
jgi:hypothetical protein